MVLWLSEWNLFLMRVRWMPYSMTYNSLRQIPETSWLILESAPILLTFCCLPGSLWHQRAGAWPDPKGKMLSQRWGNTLTSPLKAKHPFLGASGLLHSRRWGSPCLTELAAADRRGLSHLLTRQCSPWPKANDKLKRKKIDSIISVDLSYISGWDTKNKSVVPYNWEVLSQPSSDMLSRLGFLSKNGNGFSSSHPHWSFFKIRKVISKKKKGRNVLPIQSVFIEHRGASSVSYKCSNTYLGGILPSSGADLQAKVGKDALSCSPQYHQFGYTRCRCEWQMLES